MGGAAAAESFLSYPRRLGGLAVLNGWLSVGAREELEASPIKSVPVFISHCSEDDQVGFDCGEVAAKQLQEAGAKVHFEEQQMNADRSARPSSARALALQFLKSVLSWTTHDLMHHWSQSKFDADEWGGPHLIFESSKMPCKAAVIWLHGYGDQPQVWADHFEATRLSQPYWKWLFLRAPNLPQTHLNGKKWIGWGDYWTRDITIIPL
eukprot:gnl/MRDRNA2_/MRDRNA2_24129_c0_seq2.p1 gnl/MRDRNA2_/MRDRNA2_24129_c0~~gnl/MRDRNA2_/MRDRNA2_24129_c0_seq2.p1  ORF type:complete len:225 (+),score=41.09 gnl/MRDRNA2_/MRDRNA2_24129_c0_seq2:52-675(+)